MKVLLVEDAPEVSDTIKMCVSIRWPGSKVIVDWRGNEAVSLVRSEAPDIVLMELDLPAADGLEILGEIRKFSSVPIIVVSNRHDELDKVKALEFGADDYIVKPFVFTELLARMKAVTRRATEVNFIGQLRGQGVTAEDFQKATKFPELLKALADAIKNATPHLFSP